MVENNYGYYSAFVFYNKDMQRLSIFAKHDIEQDELTLTVIPCALKDEFSKKEGRRRYEQNDWKKGEVITIPVKGNMPKRTFIRFCKENYFQMITTEIPIVIEVLVKRDPQYYEELDAQMDS